MATGGPTGRGCINSKIQATESIFLTGYESRVFPWTLTPLRDYSQSDMARPKLTSHFERTRAQQLPSAHRRSRGIAGGSGPRREQRLPDPRAPELARWRRYRRDMPLSTWLTDPGADTGTACFVRWQMATLEAGLEIFHPRERARARFAIGVRRAASPEICHVEFGKVRHRTLQPT